MNRHMFRPLTFATLALVLGAGLRAEQAPITAVQADAILEELRAIRKLLERGGATGPQAQAPQMPQIAPRAKLKVDAATVMGKPDAPFTIVEYTDVQCGFCRRFQMTAFSEIRKNLIDSGKVRFVSRDLPLDAASISLRAAETIRCAGEQGLAWKLRDAVMESGARLTDDKLKELAANAGADVEKLGACVASTKYRAAIQRDIDEAHSLQINGTPTFVIGKTTSDGVDGVTMIGALGYDAFLEKLKEVGLPQ